MSQYLYSESEEQASDHREDDEETKTEAYLAARGLRRNVETGEIEEDITSVVRVKIICSCGSYTCCMISRFGHPVEVFKGDIEPLYPQLARDRRAVELKGGVMPW